MRYAEKISGEWIEKTPRQFRKERNASIPDTRLADEGLHEVTIDPRPDAPGQVVEPGPIVDRDGLPVRTWLSERKTDAEIIAGIKREANRRIIAFVPEWKQRNLLAQATLLSEKGRTNWTAAEKAAWEAGEAVWSQVEAIRAASDAIEAMSPLPVDFNLDTYWT